MENRFVVTYLPENTPTKTRKSCLDGYLTEACKNCPDWADGTDGRGFGCATHYPIMCCPHFKAMYEAEEAKEHEEVT